MRKSFDKHWYAWAMVLPTVVVVVAVVVVPVLWNVVLAFQDLTLLEVRDAGFLDALSLDNFADVLTGADGCA